MNDNRKSNGNASNLIWFILDILFAIWLVVVVAFCYENHRPGGIIGALVNPKRFDETWYNNHTYSVNDLLETRNLFGLSSSQIRELLAAPPSKNSVPIGAEQYQTTQVPLPFGDHEYLQVVYFNDHATIYRTIIIPGTASNARENGLFENWVLTGFMKPSASTVLSLPGKRKSP